MIQHLKGITSEAHALFKDLQSSLKKQEKQLAVYAQQQLQVSICYILLAYPDFKTIT